MVAAREAAEVRARADVAEFGGSFESRYRHALTDAINRKIGLVVGWMHFLMATSAADYPRATEIAAHAAQAIATLNVLLPADAQLGIFDIPRFFLDHEWLEAMRQVLPRDLARYWEQEFSVAAYAPVVRPLNELRVASVRAMLSASESVFDAREAMDAGRVVLWRTYVSGDVDVTTQVSALAFRDAVHGIMGRGQVARADRVPHEIFVDEVQRMAGAHSGRVTMQRVIQEALEQGGKFGLKMWLMSQQPSEVAEPVLRALITNARTLGSFNVGAESMLGKLGEAFDEVPKRTFAKLPLHHAVVKAHIDGVGKSEAFQVEGLILERMFPGMAATDDEVREYRRTLNRQWGARPVGDIQAEFDERRDLTMDRVQHVPESLLRLIGGMPSTVDGGVPVDRLFPDA